MEILVYLYIFIIYNSMKIFLSIKKYIFKYVYMYTCIYAYLYTCMHIYMYAYIYMFKSPFEGICHCRLNPQSSNKQHSIFMGIPRKALENRLLKQPNHVSNGQ
jgi:hypothetical protein